MRGFEQIAQEKGIIKQEPMLKKAATQKVAIDLTPTDNLMENVLKLAAALRQNQLSSEAEDLETTFFMYKKATAMYGCTNETGEDFLHSAHPRGSHKLDGIDSSEAVIEDLLERHLKILQKINKKPTGKLSEASSILNAVKIVLADDLSQGHLDQTRQTKLISMIDDTMSKVKDKLSELLKRNESHILNSSSLWMIPDSITSNMTLDDLKGISEAIDGLAQRLKPGRFYSGTTEDEWGQTRKLIGEAKGLVKDAILLRQEWISIEGGDSHYTPAKQEETQPANKQVLSDNVKKYNALLQQVKSLLASTKYTASADPDIKLPDDKQKIASFTTGMLEYISSAIEQQFNSATDKEVAAIGLIPALEKANARVEAFRKQWIK